MRIPFDDSVKNAGGINHGNTVDRNYGMRGLAINEQINKIDHQSAQMMGNAMNGAFKTFEGIYKNHRDGQNASDMAAAKRLVQDNEQQMSEEIRQTNNPAEVQEITKRYQEKVRESLKGKNPDGIPYFRNEEASKIFSDKFLKDRTSNWHRQSSETAFQMDMRNSKARLQLDIDGAMKNPNLDDPEVEATIQENLDKLAHFGVSPNDIKLRKNDALTQLDLKRVENHTVGFQNNVEKILMDDNLSVKGQKAQVEQEVARYSQYIDKLKNLSPKGKQQYKSRLQSSLKMVDSMVKSEKAMQKAQLKEQQDTNERNINLQILKAESEGKAIDYKDIAGAVNANPKGYDDAFIKEVLQGVRGLNERKAKEAETKYNQFSEGVLDQGKFMAIQEEKLYDNKLVNQILTTDKLSHEEHRALTVQMLDMHDATKRSKVSSLLANLDPSKPISGEDPVNRKSVYGKQLDNILGFGFSQKQKDKAFIDSPWYKLANDKDRFGIDDNGFEVFDGLNENQRLELKARLIEDYEAILKKQGPDKAEAYITTEMGKVEKSVDDRNYYRDYIDTKIDFKPSNKESSDGFELLENESGEKKYYNRKTKEWR